MAVSYVEWSHLPDVDSRLLVSSHVRVSECACRLLPETWLTLGVRLHFLKNDFQAQPLE